MKEMGDDAGSCQKAFYERLGGRFVLDALFDVLPETYFYAKDDQGRFVRVSTALVAMHGCQHEAEMLGRTDQDFHPPEFSNQYVAEDAQIRAAGRGVTRKMWLVPNYLGELKWFLSSKIPLCDATGTVIGVAGVMRDFERSESTNAGYREMTRVMRYVEENHGSALRVEDLAALIPLSVSQFERRFKRVFEMTPQQYILRVRIQSAMRLLAQSDLPLAHVAERCGFYDQSYFSRKFRAVTGTTPRRYRLAQGRG